MLTGSEQAQENTTLNFSKLMYDENLIIEKLKSIYGENPIPLYDESIQYIVMKASQNKFYDLLTYIKNNIQLSNEPKNLKPLLFRSPFFSSGDFTKHIIKQAFQNNLTFYQFIQCTGIPIEKARLYPLSSIQRQAMGRIILGKKNPYTLIKGGQSQNNPIDDETPISEFDILKGIKSVFLSKITCTMDEKEWESARTAIRDSLVLAESTLYLNVMRTNHTLTTLMDTKSYLKLCQLMETIPLSPEAKQTLLSRLSDENIQASPRDAAMALALVCDVEQDKAGFIKICHDHLLAENPTEVERKALNAALRLLSVADHEQLRNRLIAVSTDPSLLPTLKARLKNKNCAFIDIIRTSTDNRELKDTGKFTTWAKNINGTFDKIFKFFPPITTYNPAIHCANICTTHPTDAESGLRFSTDGQKRLVHLRNGV